MSNNLNNKPDYSPREIGLLKEGFPKLSGTNWITNESPPRKVEIKGQSAIDPDITVVKLENESKSHWLMSCSSSYDGKIIGTDIWVRETL